MAAKNTHYYLLKLARLSGWLLLPLMVIYMGTGFSMLGWLGFNRVLHPQVAKAIHQFLVWWLVGLLGLHALLTIYFAMRRWGWIKKRTGN